MSGSNFLDFANACEEIGNTRSKLTKVSILSSYLAGISSEKDLRIAVTFLSGRIFPPGEGEREPNVGYSLLWDSISEVTALGYSELSKLYVQLGDLGKVFYTILSTKKEREDKRDSARSFQRTLFHFESQGLTLSSVREAFLGLSKSVGKDSTEKKKRILSLLFSSVSDPLEGKYIVKILSGEMRIGLVEGLVEESIAKCYSKTLTEIRMANLLIADAGKVALLARNNKLEEAHLEPLQPTNFMLAQSALDAKDVYEKFSAMPVLAEFKYDGIRAQLHKKGNIIKVYSRNLADVTQFFPEFVESLKGIDLASDFMIDGEIIAFEGGGPLPFQMLQRRLRKLARSASDAPIRFFAFDLLYLDSSSLINSSFEKRISKLRSLDLPKANFSFSEQKKVSSIDEIQEMFDRSKKLGFEGLVVKVPSSPYSPGRRGNSWVKLKKELDTLDVVIVGAEYGNGKRAGVISDYTFAVRDGQELKVIGKAYSGLTDAEILEMTDLMKSITVKDYGYRREVNPQVVIEVAFDGIQKSERHNSGYALRFPRIKRIRNDKSVTDIDTLERVSQIYENQNLRIS